jgi:hypothetical protein
MTLNKIKNSNLGLPKQIVSDYIPYDTEGSEAFVYKFTNLLKKKFYVGIHKGKPYDGYMTSSKNEDFHKDFMAEKSEWHYEVLFYGSFDYAKAMEHNILTAVNAKDNPKWYNKHNGGSPLGKLPNMKLIKSMATEMLKTKSYIGVKSLLTKVADLPKFIYQVREVTIDKEHVNQLKDRVNETGKLDHLLVIILENRTFEGQTGDLIIGGNHSIEAATRSNWGNQSLIPTLRIPKHIHEKLDDLEVQLLANFLNPRIKNPRLVSSLDDIARQVFLLKEKGLDASSKEVQELYDYHHLTKKEKAQTSKRANKIFLLKYPTTHTYIEYGSGADNRKQLAEIKKEHITDKNKSGIFSKLKSTAKNDFWPDLYDMITWNRDNPKNKIKVYKIRWYHVNEHYKTRWEEMYRKNNEYVIDKVLKANKIKKQWIYLPETRNKLSKGGI